MTAKMTSVMGVELIDVGMDWETMTGKFTFTPDDLVSCIESQSDPAVRPPIIKLGHTDPRFDGQPSIGKIVNLRTSNNGMTLLGDLVGLPAWMVETDDQGNPILAAAFPRRSIEGIFGAKTHTGNEWSLVLTGLALLGTAYPAITTLEDIAAMWGDQPPTLVPVDETMELVAASAVPGITGELIMAHLPGKHDQHSHAGGGRGGSHTPIDKMSKADMLTELSEHGYSGPTSYTKTKLGSIVEAQRTASGGGALKNDNAEANALAEKHRRTAGENTKQPKKVVDSYDKATADQDKRYGVDTIDRAEENRLNRSGKPVPDSMTEAQARAEVDAHMRYYAETHGRDPAVWEDQAAYNTLKANMTAATYYGNDHVRMEEVLPADPTIFKTNASPMHVPLNTARAYVRMREGGDVKYKSSKPPKSKNLTKHQIDEIDYMGEFDVSPGEHAQYAKYLASGGSLNADTYFRTAILGANGSRAVSPAAIYASQVQASRGGVTLTDDGFFIDAAGRRANGAGFRDGILMPKPDTFEPDPPTEIGPNRGTKSQEIYRVAMDDVADIRIGSTLTLTNDLSLADGGGSDVIAEILAKRGITSLSSGTKLLVTGSRPSGAGTAIEMEMA